jgi:uncharacterized membrane-anchored protein
MTIPEFAEGSRYQDYVPGVGKVAAYGIGGLIAGKAAAKLGLLAGALAFLKKGWILLVLAGGWIIAKVRGQFSRGAGTDA